ncbi:phosphatase PAP2 family protein [Streptomyces zhihengii]|uniref:phosphatase PAP2 family protein n=1 Tax=Streptomyces zhihengii TaxID=1818004 RepID=UPI0036C90472
MRETPASRETAGGAGPEPPQPRPGRAIAHTAGASRSGTPHRSDGRPPHTPRGARQTGPAGHTGTTPPVPVRPASRRSRAAVAAVCGALFALITWQVVAHGPLRDADERLGRAVFRVVPDALTQPLADLGGMAVAPPVLALAAGWVLWRGREWLRAGAALLAMAAVPALVAPLKLLIARPGPLEPGTGWYPSGHTATAMVAYVAAAMLISPYTRRRWPMPVAVVLTVATGIGLVLRGYHWPLDVLGSWCLFGAVLVVLGSLGSGSAGISSSGRRRSSSRTRTG